MSEVFAERFVAFIDILGFARLVERAAIDPVLAVRLRDILTGMERVRLSKRAHGAAKSLLTFSDSIVLSDEVLKHVIVAALAVQRTLLQIGVLCRGGVTVGPLYHESTVVFGPAMVRAYRVESSAAVFPRIVVDHHVLVRIRGEEWRTILEQDTDGQWILPVFRDWDVMKSRERAIALGRHLVEGHREAERFDDPGVDAKWHWVIRRFNAAQAVEQPDLSSIEVKP